MAITLYGISGSPLVWRVLLTLEHKELNYDIKWLSLLTGDLRKPEFLLLNPRGKVPVLTDDNLVLYETSCIIEYLDERYPQNNLFPNKPAERALIRKTLSEIDCYFFSELRYLMQQIFLKPETDYDMDLLTQAQTQIFAELKYCEQIQYGDYFLGELSVLDYALYPMLAMALHLEKRKPDLNISRAIGPNLQRWMRNIEALPYFTKTIPPHWRDN
jgi:glutathione S-transferase